MGDIPDPSLSDISGDDAPSIVDLGTGQTQLTEQVIMALSNAIEAKDRYTNGHSLRVASYSMELARRLGWDETSCTRAYYAGILHDVGKISVPDEILNKTGRLTEEEYEEIKLHTIVGYYILKGISSISDFAIGARWHHERYDGLGYPNGLSGENIPLLARIISVADAYDSMTSNRSYRQVMTQEKVRSEIEEGLGAQFDPEIGALMLAMIDEDADFKMHQPARRSKYMILAVDDDPDELQLLEFFIHKDDRFKAALAGSGADALQRFQEEKFDVVLLDVDMDGMDGFAVLEAIRAIDSQVPVIFMTDEKDMTNIMKAESMGVSDYLTKPLTPRMLKQSVENVLFSSFPEELF